VPLPLLLRCPSFHTPTPRWTHVRIIPRSRTHPHSHSHTVSRPDLDEAVFCVVREDIGEYQLEDNETIHMEVGNIYILRYRAIQTLLADKRVELV
jgi:hypothetical protein